MLYPGQVVYIPKEKKVGIYVSYRPPMRSIDKPDMYVWIYIGNKGEHSDNCVLEPKEIIPVTQPDNKSLTGTKLYISPFQRDSFVNYYVDEELPLLETAFNEELEKVMSQKWFVEQYGELELEK